MSTPWHNILDPQRRTIITNVWRVSCKKALPYSCSILTSRVPPSPRRTATFGSSTFFRWVRNGRRRKRLRGADGGGYCLRHSQSRYRHATVHCACFKPYSYIKPFWVQVRLHWWPVQFSRLLMAQTPVSLATRNTWGRLELAGCCALVDVARWSARL